MQERIQAFQPAPESFSFTERDVILYALGGELILTIALWAVCVSRHWLLEEEEDYTERSLLNLDMAYTDDWVLKTRFQRKECSITWIRLTLMTGC